MWKTSLLAGLAALVLLNAAPRAYADELTVFATGSMAEPLKALGETFSRRTGHEIRFVLGPTGVVLGKVRAGEKADVIVISAEAADTLQKEARIVTGSRTDIARSLFGVGIRTGAPIPDISTEEAFKKTVLAARSLSYSDPALGSASGIYVEKIFQTLGIAEEAKRKTVIKPIGLEVTEAVAKGDVELALTFISEMAANKGVTIVGPFPGALQNPTLYAAAVSSTSANGQAARDFIAFAASAEAAATLKEAGVDPIAGTR